MSLTSQNEERADSVQPEFNAAVIHMSRRIILASKSPRRHEILNIAGLDHEVRVSNANENVGNDIPCAEAVRIISKRKAEAVLHDVMSENEGATADFVVIGADTALEVDGVLLGKPKDTADAERMLRTISKRGHLVHTGITVTDGIETVSETVTTAVYMRELSETDIHGYAESGEGLDKAGAYAIQGKAGAFVTSVDGDFFNVIGLPLCRVCEILPRFGITLFEEG